MNIAQLFVIVGPYYTVPVTRGSPNPRFLRLPQRLTKARKAADVTRRALEQKAGGTNGAILYIEEGRRVPTVETVARLAHALGVRAAWLAYGVEELDAAGFRSTTVGMAARLLAVRAAQQLSRAELGRRTGLSPRAIAKIEAGGQSGVDVIEMLAKALRISPAWLAFNEGPQVLPASRRGRPPAQSPADAR
ncbi:MAG: helix-turn-helix transcriptional regulator [Myxococcales bacterium]|nr:helix-turn-helix transcriptional regulator [Myxococcales bacterium]